MRQFFGGPGVGRGYEEAVKSAMASLSLSQALESSASLLFDGSTVANSRVGHSRKVQRPLQPRNARGVRATAPRKL